MCFLTTVLERKNKTKIFECLKSTSTMQSKWTPILTIPIRLSELAANPQDSSPSEEWHKSTLPGLHPPQLTMCHLLSRHSSAHCSLSGHSLLAPLYSSLHNFSGLKRLIFHPSWTMHAHVLHARDRTDSDIVKEQKALIRRMLAPCRGPGGTRTLHQAPKALQPRMVLRIRPSRLCCCYGRWTPQLPALTTLDTGCSQGHCHHPTPEWTLRGACCF